MKYTGTRKKTEVSALEAIVKGLADDGGLFVPERIPVLPKEFFDGLKDMDFLDIASYLFKLFIPELDQSLLTEIVSYSASCFEEGEPAPVFKVSDELFVLELWHGPTCAFKDVALTVLPRLLVEAKKKLGITSKTMILTATSGDTGSAALNGFKDVSGTCILVLYPYGNVSELQELQMTTQEGQNVKVLAIDGNFDDAQRAVKRAFSDVELRTKLYQYGCELSSANSINLGRLLPQIVYYFSTYALMLDAGQIASGERINFAVPSGNFGNILAGFYAMKMGLPLNRLICASNANNVLADFLTTGEYNADRSLIKTTSPSMDILVSSNLERLIFEITDRDHCRTAELMECLKNTSKFKLTAQELETVQKVFYGGSCDDAETAQALQNFFEAEEYLCDPHTAVALACNSNYVAETGDESKTVVVSTASPFKFERDVLKAVGVAPRKKTEDNHEEIMLLSGLIVPDALDECLHKKVRFNKTILPQALEDEILSFAKKEGMSNCSDT